MTQYRQVNNITITLNGALDNSQVTMLVTGSTSDILANTPVLAVIENEIVAITGGTGQTLNITRGQDGTTGAAHADTSTVSLFHCAANINNLIDEKEDKVAGKGLSENDFTNTLLSKLNGIESAANNYSHPSAHAISFITGLQSALDAKLTNPMTSKADIVTRNSSGPVRLAVGVNGQLLSCNTSTASGLEWKDEQPLPVFGNGFEEDYKQAAESSATLATYHTLVSATKPAGKYRVGWKVTIVGSNTSNDAICYVKANGVDLGERYQLEPKDPGTDQRGNFTGMGYITLATAGTITIIVTYDSSSSNVARIYDSQLEVWRVE